MSVASLLRINTRCIAIFCVCCVIYCLYLLTSNFDKGLDITDESLYILAARSPEDITAAYNQYGHYTNLILKFSGGNLQIFRTFGLLILVTVAYLFIESLYKHPKLDHLFSGGTFSEKILFVSSGISGALTYYCIWLTTPSYNWLALVSILVTIFGILTAGNILKSQNYRKKFLPPSFLIGVGGAMTFLAKPTSAAILSALLMYSVLFKLVPIRPFRLVTMSAFFAGITLLAHVLLFENSINAFFQEYRDGLEITMLLDGGHNTVQLLENSFTSIYRFIPFIKENMMVSLTLIVLFIPAALIYIAVRRKGYNSSILQIFVAAILVITFLELLYRDKWAGGDNIGTYLAYPTLSILALILFLSFILYCLGRLSNDDLLMDKYTPHLVLVVFLVFAAAAFSFGSNLGLVRRMSFAFVFIFPAILISSSWIDNYFRSRIIFGLSALLVHTASVIILTTASYNPQRLVTSVHLQTLPLKNSNRLIQSLYFDEASQTYAKSLLQLAMQGGWEDGTPLIDLTGGTPGAALILNGQAPVTPWLIGGYPGSNESAKAALKLFDRKQLNSAWILSTISGERRIDTNVLKSVNLDFPNDYIQLGSVITGHRKEVQELWKPNHLKTF